MEASVVDPCPASDDRVDLCGSQKRIQSLPETVAMGVYRGNRFRYW